MALLEVTWYEQQLAYIARGKTPKPDQSVWLSLAKTILTTGFQVFQKRRAWGGRRYFNIFQILTLINRKS
ncbi:MAG: hypothetical protein R2874_11060 [Desulfobacterales bacterium]